MSKQEVKLASVRKSCKAAKVVSRILSWFMLVCGMIAAVSGGIVFALSDKINPIMAANADGLSIANPEINGFLSLSINLEGMIAAGEYAKAIGIACIFGAVVCLVVFIIFHLLSRAFVQIEKSESPFTASVQHYLKTVFIAIVVILLVMCGVGIAVMVGLSLWCVYCIMDYGCALQEEVDDTI